jgi:nitroreductase
MEVKEAVLTRRSIRAFSSDPVPKKVLEEIMERALRAPSWGNTQPWKFTIVGGQTLDKIKEEFILSYKQGASITPDFPFQLTFNEVQTIRYKSLGKSLFQALGIGREEFEKREAYVQDMTRFFGAPFLVYLHFDQGFNPYALMDGGIILQTIALLAVEQGLGTCILTRSVSYPEVVRKHTGIPSDQALVMGLGIGFPLQDHPANLFRSERGKQEEFISWVDVV